MKILWISSIAWKDSAGYPYPVNGAGAVSGSLFQQSMIEGLEELGHSVDIVADYPYAIGCNIRKQIQWSHNNVALDTAIKTIDIPYLSLFYKACMLKKIVKQKVMATKYDFAVAYLIHQPYMKAIAYAKQINKQIKTILICPDLPDMMDMSLSSKKFKSFLKKIDQKRINRLYKKMDGFVLFTELMREKIDIGSAMYTVIEGVASVDDLDVSPVKKERFILYAGTLHRNIGIENLIDSLEYVNDKEVKLKIYGTGELEEYIMNKAVQNSRIVYGGFIDRKELFEEQKKAIALVNARNPKDAYTKYSFPSKTFEYLYSGTPFITTKLMGVPNEYSQYLYETEDDQPKSIAKIINQIDFWDVKKQEEHATLVREYVISEKSKLPQAKKLIYFLMRQE